MPLLNGRFPPKTGGLTGVQALTYITAFSLMYYYFANQFHI